MLTVTVPLVQTEVAEAVITGATGLATVVIFTDALLAHCKEPTPPSTAVQTIAGFGPTIDDLK